MKCFQLDKKSGMTKLNIKNIPFQQIFLYLLLDLFYLSIFKAQIILQFIFGGLVLICVFANLSIAFLSSRNNSFFIKFGQIQDLVIGIGLTIYLIYIIPVELVNLQTIVTSILAAVYGGLITLVGVAWTIKKQDKIRQEEEKKKYKPMLHIHHGDDYQSFITVTCEQFDPNKAISFEPSNKKEYTYKFNNFLIKNADLTACYFCGFIINGIDFDRNRNLYLEKNSYIKFILEDKKLYTTQKVMTISFLLKDLISNKYELELGFTTNNADSEVVEITIDGSKKLIEKFEDAD